MGIAFAIIAVVTIASAVAAMSLRNLVHCALALAVAFAGLAVIYLQLDAQFVGFAQLLVYVGAVSILIVFAIVLTRSGDTGKETVFSTSWFYGLAIVAAVLGVLVWAITKSGATHKPLPSAPGITVQKIGEALMSKFVLPLEVIGLLLTVALIGAVIIALHEKEPKK